MSTIRGKIQAQREGRPFGLSWTDYLDRIVETDQEIEAVRIRLDEEGNHHLEMNGAEVNQFILALKEAVDEMRHAHKCVACGRNAVRNITTTEGRRRVCEKRTCAEHAISQIIMKNKDRVDEDKAKRRML